MKYLIAGIILLASSCSKKNSGSTSLLPSVFVSSISQNREDTNSVFQFIVSLANPVSNHVSIQYATEDGTAIANKDYLPVTGTVTISSGQTQAFIKVVVIGDSLRQAYQKFYLRLSGAVNCSLSSDSAIATIQNDGTYLPTDTSGYTSPLSYPGYNLVWSDEFNSNSINNNNWNFETGGGGWGNNELENYTSRIQNAFQSCGHLIIEARNENYNGSNYTSARMTTQNKQKFQYGRIDIRAKLPVGIGLWPALWMLGANISSVGWPTCGETDIMELIGNNPQEVYGTLHWANTNGSDGSLGSNYSLSSGDFSQQFHVFSLIWKQDSIAILIDDQTYFFTNAQSITGGKWPFNSNFFFVFNVAVGGNWPGSPDGSTVFPERLFVDYVRVFQ